MMHNGVSKHNSIATIYFLGWMARLRSVSRAPSNGCWLREGMPIVREGRGKHLKALRPRSGAGEWGRKAGMDDITQELRDSAALKMQVAETQGDIIQAMVECMWESLQQGGKLLWCGNGGSAADAQHLATECMVRLEVDREPLPAIALTTDTSLLTAAGNDHGFETIF